MLWIERTQAMMILTYKTINTHTENGDVGLSFFSLARCVSDWASFILRRFFSSVFFFRSFDVSNKATTIYSYSFDIRAPYFCNSSFFYSAPIFLWALVLCSSGNAACAKLPPPFCLFAETKFIQIRLDCENVFGPNNIILYCHYSTNLAHRSKYTQTGIQAFVLLLESHSVAWRSAKYGNDCSAEKNLSS